MGTQVFKNGLQNITDPKVYTQNTPFPSGVLDNFLQQDVVDAVLREWPEQEAFNTKAVGTSVKSSLSDSSKFGPETQKLFEVLNGVDFLKELERVTGIPNLIADPSLEGGGLHMITRGGFLKIHADFNWHLKMSKMRMINLLVYLNEDWNEEWGGHLELIGPPETLDTKVTIAPLNNRAVLFNTTSDSWHGHPEPLKCPENRQRKSIALYYYSADEPQPEVAHYTLYREDLERPALEFENHYYL